MKRFASVLFFYFVVLCFSTSLIIAKKYVRLRRAENFYNTKSQPVAKNLSCKKKDPQKKQCSREVSGTVNSKIIVKQSVPEEKIALDAQVKRFVKKETGKNHLLVKVLLERCSQLNKISWTFSSCHGFIIAALDSKKDYYIKSSTLSLSFKHNKIFINANNAKLCLEGDLMIIPYKGHIEYNNNSYHGTFLISHKFQDKAKKIQEAYLVNYVDLEDYVLSVLPAESWPGWPEEVNKAFCICFRTYALSKILEQRKSDQKSGKKSLYDIRNTNIHQTYKGFKVQPVFKAAVDKTRGMILAYNNKPIVAMFDSCCGGIVPSKLSGVNFRHAPYLERLYPCNYCKECFLYSWNKELSLSDFQAVLNIKSTVKIQDIRVTKKDAAGKVCEVKIKKNNSWITYTGKEFYALFPHIKSFCYNITKRGQKVNFKGSGYGHHLGLCQWGAYAMVKQGWNYKNILKFYYPHTYLMKLQLL